MLVDTSKQTYIVQRKYPFLQNFPFAEFQIKVGEFSAPSMQMDDEPSSTVIDPKLVKFVYDTIASSMTIVVFEQELNWIDSVAHKVTNLDEAARIIENGLQTEDFLSKRDAVNFADTWCAQLHDSTARLSYSTSGEILTSLVKNHFQLASIINKIVKFASGIGLVSLTAEEYSIILTYYQFQLIYAKLMLGLVIGSKLSL